MENLSELEVKLHAVTTELANELIGLTPEFMHEIQFEIVSTDRGADIGLMEIQPEVKYVALSEGVKYHSPGLPRQRPPWVKSLHPSVAAKRLYKALYNRFAVNQSFGRSNPG